MVLEFGIMVMLLCFNADEVAKLLVKASKSIESISQDTEGNSVEIWTSFKFQTMTVVRKFQGIRCIITTTKHLTPNEPA